MKDNDVLSQAESVTITNSYTCTSLHVVDAKKTPEHTGLNELDDSIEIQATISELIRATTIENESSPKVTKGISASTTNCTEPDPDSQLAADGAPFQPQSLSASNQTDLQNDTNAFVTQEDKSACIAQNSNNIETTPTAANETATSKVVPDSTKSARYPRGTIRRRRRLSRGPPKLFSRLRGSKTTQSAHNTSDCANDDPTKDPATKSGPTNTPIKKNCIEELIVSSESSDRFVAPGSDLMAPALPTTKMETTNVHVAVPVVTNRGLTPSLRNSVTPAVQAIQVGGPHESVIQPPDSAPIHIITRTPAVKKSWTGRGLVPHDEIMEQSTTLPLAKSTVSGRMSTERSTVSGQASTELATVHAKSEQSNLASACLASSTEGSESSAKVLLSENVSPKITIPKESAQLPTFVRFGESYIDRLNFQKGVSVIKVD
eukprot:Filipodium_phascolosomae@DN3706_c0_g1_i1.p1